MLRLTLVRSGSLVLSHGVARSRIMVLSRKVARSANMVLSHSVARSRIMVLSRKVATDQSCARDLTPREGTAAAA